MRRFGPTAEMTALGLNHPFGRNTSQGQIQQLGVARPHGSQPANRNTANMRPLCDCFGGILDFFQNLIENSPE
jgi:hypothetical protein